MAAMSSSKEGFPAGSSPELPEAVAIDGGGPGGLDGAEFAGGSSGWGIWASLSPASGGAEHDSEIRLFHDGFQAAADGIEPIGYGFAGLIHV